MDELRLAAAAISLITTWALFVRLNDAPSSVGRSGLLLRYLLVTGYLLASLGILEHYVRRSDLTFFLGAWTVHCLVMLGVLWHRRGR